MCWVALLLAGCSGGATPTLFVPAPRLEDSISTATITPGNSLTAGIETKLPQPSPSPDCQSNLLYIEDITIPDGTQVSPADGLDKRWLVQNNGTCNWDQRFSIRLIAGPDLGAGSELALYPARSGNQVQIQIQFTAPQEAGLYRSAWQATDPQGNLFGDPIFIEINVVNP